MTTSRNADGDELHCPTCPVCAGPPSTFHSVWLTPWFCANDDCDVLAWDPYSTLDENLMDARPVEVEEKSSD